MAHSKEGVLHNQFNVSPEDPSRGKVLGTVSQYDQVAGGQSNVHRQTINHRETVKRNPNSSCSATPTTLIRDAGPYSTRNTGKGALLVESGQVVDALAGGMTIDQVRDSVLGGSVPGATPLTPRVAEVLFLIHEIPYIPRTADNIARLMVENTDEDVSIVLARVQPELDRLIAAGLIAQIGEEYEFLTGERRSFEEEVTTVEQQYRQEDKERGLARHFVHEAGKAHWRAWFGSDACSPTPFAACCATRRWRRWRTWVPQHSARSAARS